MADNNAPRAGQPGAEESGMQVRPMGLKVHYSFDKDNQEKCLGRWPHILQVQTMPLDETTIIGVVDLKTCLQTVAQCSPELVGNLDNDYTVYAYDYSEPDIPLVGQGMLSWALDPCSEEASRSLVTGRVTKNILAIFGNGIRETLEVKLKLTAVPKFARVNPPAPHNRTESTPCLTNFASNMTESAEWNTLIQSNPNFGHRGNASAMSSPALPPARLFNPTCDARNGMRPSSQGGPVASGSRPASVDSHAMNHGFFSQPASAPVAGPPPPMESSTSTAPAAKKPRSRASSKAPTGRPRGRPRKKPIAAEGSTSGYEDGTDADDGPPNKKRATTTKAERSNTATFGSAPESLRVAASTAGSLRSFRPVGPGVEASGGSHLHEMPRAPTPIPDQRPPGPPHSKSTGPSNLRPQSISGLDRNSVFTAHPGMGRTTSQQDVQTPIYSMAPSPSQYSDASPADMGSSPPAPRAMYSVQSSPAPSSPMLPPMPAPQPDSGFMSGGIEEVSLDGPPKPVSEIAAPAPVVAKPKPKRAPRTKKPQPSKKNFVVHAETPGPPEFLPTTVLYTGPPPSRKNAETPKTPAVIEQPGSQQPEPNKFEMPTEPASGLRMHPQGSKSDARAGGPQVPHIVSPHQEFTSDSFALDDHSRPSVPLAHEAKAGNAKPMHPPLQRSMSAMTTVEPNMQPSLPPLKRSMSEMPTAEATSDPQATMPNDVTPDRPQDERPEPEPTQENPQDTPGEMLSDLELSLMRSLNDGGFSFDDLTSTDMHGLTTENQQAHYRSVAPSIEPSEFSTNPPQVGRAGEATIVEPGPSSVPGGHVVDPGMPRLTFPLPPSEVANPESDMADPMSNKNYVKKQAIKQKLEEAIAKGQLPPFCSNCGAIQTPTWRKIWKQQHKGVPSYHEYSEKPGRVTAINVLDKDAEGQPTLYEMIKKTLGPFDNKLHWKEVLLCNPCGIWFSKWKAQRPSDKWEKDQDRLSQVRKKRANAEKQTSRTKKVRTKSASQEATLTSEAGFPTDPLGPVAGGSPKGNTSSTSVQNGWKGGAENPQGPGSTHSRASTHSGASGTPNSPIALDDDLGPTRRLLFPSPRKDGEQKVLRDVAGNATHASPSFRKVRAGETETENGTLDDEHHDDFIDLFGTPPRPSTPPPRAVDSGSFKTPNRPTPSHRPITRSVTKSIRSSRSLKSPGQALLQRTPTKTPRSSAAPSSALRRRNQSTPSNYLNDTMTFESPFTRSVHQLLFEANDFIGSTDLDFDNMPQMDDGGQFFTGDHYDFSGLLSTDAAVPSSPPMAGRGHQGQQLVEHHVTFGGELVVDETGRANLLKHVETADAEDTSEVTGEAGGNVN